MICRHMYESMYKKCLNILHVLNGFLQNNTGNIQITVLFSNPKAATDENWLVEEKKNG